MTNFCVTCDTSDRDCFFLQSEEGPYVKMPRGRLADCDPESSLAKFIDCFESQIKVFDDYICDITSEWFLDSTESLFTRHEIDFSLNRTCVAEIEDQCIRRKYMAFIERRKKIVTEADFIELAACFGFNIEVECSNINKTYIYDYPLTYTYAGINYRWVWKIHFPDIIDGSQPYEYKYDFVYGQDDPALDFLKCIFEELNPAPAVIQYSFGTNAPEDPCSI